MAKYQVNFPKGYKGWFTLADLETIKAIKSDSSLQDTIETMVSVLANGREVLKVSLEWCKDNGSDFFGNDTNIDIWVELITKDWDSFHISYASFSRINTICGDADKVGIHRIYKEQTK